MGSASRRVDVDAATVHAGFVVDDVAVVEGRIVVQIDTCTAACVAVLDGETVPDGE